MVLGPGPTTRPADPTAVLGPVARGVSAKQAHRAGNLWRPSFMPGDNLHKPHTEVNLEETKGAGGRSRPTVARFLTQMQQIKPRPGSPPSVDAKPPPSNNVTLRSQEVLTRPPRTFLFFFHYIINNLRFKTCLNIKLHFR